MDEPLPLQRLLQPRSLALIGASDQPASLGTTIVQQVLGSPFQGDLHLVNRHRSEVFGHPVLVDAAYLPSDVDLAMVMTPWAGVPEVIDALVERRCANAVVVDVASERGWPWASTASVLARLKRRLAGSRMRLIGPASQGVMLASERLNLSLCPVLPPPGGIGFVAASGAIASVIADWAHARNIGMSALISLGDACDVSLADVFDLLARDPKTRAVLVHMDDLPLPRQTLSAARALAFRKPLVVLRSQRRDGDAELINALHRAAFLRAGMLEVHDLDELCAATNVDLPTWPHAGQRFAIAANGRALGDLAADAVLASASEIATLAPSTLKSLKALLPPRSELGNPLDLKRDAGPERYNEALKLLARDPNVDVVLLLHHPTRFAKGEDIAVALDAVDQLDALALAAFAGADQHQARRLLAEHGIAAFATPGAAVRAYALNRRYYAQKARLMRTPPPLQRWPDVKRAAFLEFASDGVWSEPTIRRWLGLLQLSLEFDAGAEGPGLLIDAHPLGAHVRVVGLADSPIEFLPVDRARVARLVDALGLSAPASAACSADVLSLCDWMNAIPALREIQLVGIRADSQGRLFAGLRVRCQLAARETAFAFAPYPWELLEEISLPNGQVALLRAIRAEDEPALQAGFTQLSPEEVRLRFLYPLKAMTHDLAARLSQLDDDREIALVVTDLEPPGQARLMSVARASLDLARSEAEFAIVIPRQLSGAGLGTQLLTRLIDIVRRRGMTRMVGDTLPENAAMRRLAHKLGFIEHHAEGLVRLEKKLI
jgi:acyl-CoA synthetase (NDP forming)/RimJ/RimL family protein N-acetyltransferase